MSKILAMLCPVLVVVAFDHSGRSALAAEPAGLVIIHVDDDAVGANDGTSWPDAYSDLQEALDFADTLGVPVEIRIAQGIYRPYGYHESFHLKSGQAWVGGFAGLGADDPDQRDPALFRTILSGEIPPPPLYQECVNVVVAIDVDSSTLLDGLIIEKGHEIYYGGNEGPGYLGGTGLYIRGSATVRDCVIENNTAPDCWDEEYDTVAADRGGGVYIEGDVRLIRTTVRGNRAGDGTFCGNKNGVSGAAGGGLYIESDLVTTILDSTIADNLAGEGGVGCIASPFSAGCPEPGGDGGGIYLAGGGLYVEDSVFAFNKTGAGAGKSCGLDDPKYGGQQCSPAAPGGEGGAVSVDYGVVTLRNCTIYGNIAAGDFGSFAGNVDCIDCIVWGNTGEGPNDGNLDTVDPMLVDPDNGVFSLAPNSPAINDGDPDFVPDPADRDHAGNPRVLCGRIDRGAVEFTDCSIFLDDWPWCMTGPFNAVNLTGCAALDANGDYLIDLRDFARFSNTFMK